MPDKMSRTNTIGPKIEQELRMPFEHRIRRPRTHALQSSALAVIVVLLQTSATVAATFELDYRPPGTSIREFFRGPDLLGSEATIETELGDVEVDNDLEFNHVRPTIEVLSPVTFEVESLSPVVRHGEFEILIHEWDLTERLPIAAQNVPEISAITDEIRLTVPGGGFAYTCCLESNVRTFEGRSTPIRVLNRISYTTPLGDVVAEDVAADVVVALTLPVDHLGRLIVSRTLVRLEVTYESERQVVSGTDPISGLPLELRFGLEGPIATAPIVPEPGTGFLLGLGLSLLAARRRRRGDRLERND